MCVAGGVWSRGDSVDKGDVTRWKSVALFVGPLILAATPPLVVATLVGWVCLERRPLYSDNAPREVNAIAALRRIHTAQQEFSRSFQGRYGSLDELTQRTPEWFAPTFLPPSYAPLTLDSTLRKDYYIRVHVLGSGATSPLGDWFAYAWPVSDPLCYRTFVIWSDGSVFGTSRYAGPLYPPSSCAFPAGSVDDGSLWYVAADGSEWRMVG